jgi:dolichol-phosphate mannosyltransferase
MKVSVVVPARNEQDSIGICLDGLRHVVRDTHHILYEILVVDDGSTDDTAQIVRRHMGRDPDIRLVERTPPCGFGRAVRAGLALVTGDVVVICMADGSDDPEDVVRYVRKIEEGCDCVFGSRFIAGARVVNYPPVKHVLNRLGNRGIQLLFWTGFNDLTNAFKAYRTRVILECGPFAADHFDLTLELALTALMRPYAIAQIPIAWTGRTAGHSKLRLPLMCVRYLAVVATLFLRQAKQTRVLARWFGGPTGSSAGSR